MALEFHDVFLVVVFLVVVVLVVFLLFPELPERLYELPLEELLLPPPLLSYLLSFNFFESS